MISATYNFEEISCHTFSFQQEELCLQKESLQGYKTRRSILSFLQYPSITAQFFGKEKGGETFQLELCLSNAFSSYSLNNILGFGLFLLFVYSISFLFVCLFLGEGNSWQRILAPKHVDYQHNHLQRNKF